MNERDLDRTFIDHGNGFTMINIRLLQLGTNPYDLPSQCEQDFYSQAPSKEGWSYVIKCDTPRRHVNYIVLEEDSIEEDQQEDAEEQVDLLDQEVE